MPASVNPTDIEVMISHPFAVAYLQLCQISYDDPAKIPDEVSRLPPLHDGVWQCVWGPAQDASDANLVFVAVCRDRENNQPILAAVVIRGTDPSVPDAWGVLKQAFEDLDVTKQSRPPWVSNEDVLVADGTLDALRTIQELKAGGQTLLEFLIQRLNAQPNQQSALIVTGHSLGGCLASVVAPWLQVSLNAAGLSTLIIPATFAAPSAGNAGFAAYCARQFPHSLRCFNSLDVVPKAWAELDAIGAIYGAFSVLMPDAASWGLWAFREMMRVTKVSYVQPPTNPIPLIGQSLQSRDWYAEALHQHHTTTYMSLLGGASVASAVSHRQALRTHRNQRRAGAPSHPAPG